MTEGLLDRGYNDSSYITLLAFAVIVALRCSPGFLLNFPDLAQILGAYAIVKNG
jgi:hypothetical protein